MAAVGAPSIGVGTGVLNVWTRSAATLAMAAAGPSQLSGGRFILGLGAGSRGAGR
jgi:alkanesulfonate monooxygenase SsuD/methylene tetrahydromethanopterin reductase-like flavin-dependent oxidoreductase (luciferase family)